MGTNWRCLRKHFLLGGGGGGGTVLGCDLHNNAISVYNQKYFVSSEFEDFLKELGISHCKALLYYPRAKGEIES